MRFRTASSGSRISSAATRPCPSAVGNSVCVTTPCSEFAIMMRTCSCCSAGKTSMMRSIVEGVQDGREAELLERLDLLRDETEGRADGLALVVDVDTEARDAGKRIGEVELALQLEHLLLLAREDPVQKRARVVGRERVEALGAHDLPAYA